MTNLPYSKPLLAALGLLLSRPATAQTALKMGDALPDFALSRVVNSKSSTFSPADAKGKVLVLEFWGTTCSPCIPALQRLEALQRRYPADLQVVGISTDSEARLQKFLAKRPLTVPLASAPDPDEINRLFPHRMVSHTVVVDKNRRVVAITSPQEFTEQALRDVVAGKTIRLKPKQDVMSYDPMSYFSVDSTTRYGVNVRPFIQGLRGQTRSERKDPFARRRFTAINVDPATLFQIAYETSQPRLINQLPDSLRQYDDLNKFCFDLIVPPGQEANQLPIMREALRLYLPIQADWVPMTKPAYVLRRLKNSSPPPPSSKPKNYSFGGGEFRMEGSPVETLRDYLENELEKPVVDETGLTKRYDAALVTQNENLKPSISAALAKLGLEVVEAPREVRMLRLSPATAR